MFVCVCVRAARALKTRIHTQLFDFFCIPAYEHALKDTYSYTISLYREHIL